MDQLAYNSNWRMVAAALYRRPVDSKIFGSVELDVTELEAYVQRKRKEGLKITFTHLFTLAVARALREEVPELNCYIRRGKTIHREQVDATVSVLMEKGSEMSSIAVPNADQMTLQELVLFFQTSVQAARQGEENATMRKKKLIAAIPWPFRAWILNLIRKLTNEWGISLPGLGLSANSFGSFILSNIGSIGLEMGYPALFPSANFAFVLIMGGLSTKPAVVNDTIVPRRMLQLGAALDHRVVDAIHGGRLFNYLKKALQHPEVFEQKPQWLTQKNTHA
ncbi:MAG: 2-oxo acid dehydrogenase subunit E2 [Lewinellaceae bacterium]|nr:2-oxo acid dehydrogenase subunit E2 [Lewinellaceae bacterium]